MINVVGHANEQEKVYTKAQVDEIVKKALEDYKKRTINKIKEVLNA